MGTLNTFTSANRVIDTGLHVEYFKRLAYGTWTGTTVVASDVTQTYQQMFEVHRTAAKTYRYTGMDKATAYRCAAAMRAKYTRTYKVQQWNPASSQGTTGSLGAWEIVRNPTTGLPVLGSEIMASVVPVHVAASLWDVVIDVSEDDVRMAKTTDTVNYDTMFADEKLREYDGETEADITPADEGEA